MKVLILSPCCIGGRPYDQGLAEVSDLDGKDLIAMGRASAAPPEPAVEPEPAPELEPAPTPKRPSRSRS